MLAWGECAFVKANAEPLWGTERLRERWIDAIVDHPWAYLRHRADHLWTFSVVTGRYGFYYDYVDGRLDWKPNRNVVMDGYDAVINVTDTWPFMRPVFWQLASVALLGLVLWRRRAGRSGDFDPLIAAAMLGNLAFYAQWGLIGVSDEFRYSYTVVTACIVCAITLVIERWGHDPVPSALAPDGGRG